MPLRRVAIVGLICASLSGCYGETFSAVTMARASDGARAECGTGTYAVSAFSKRGAEGGQLARCVVACEKLGFTIQNYSPVEFEINRSSTADVRPEECEIPKAR